MLTPIDAAAKAAPAALQILSKGGRYLLSPDEERRMLEALADALATPGQRVQPNWKVWTKLGRRRRRNQAIRQLSTSGISSGARVLLSTAGERPGDWRRSLVEVLHQTLAAAQQPGPSDHHELRARAAEAVRTFELRMAADAVLRYVLARMDYDDEHATRLRLATALEDVGGSMATISGVVVLAGSTLAILTDNFW